MSDVAIKVENVSKLYQLGEVGTGTLSRDIERWWAAVRGKEDPFAKIGQVNDRTTKAESDFVWALKDINFEVKKGEVLGIIGRNGAGKSTLLKILSKITSPTKGKIYLDGRIASLLEVGTGFHPEMTGRENIFMNGAILGMRKKEIQKKFDAIVDFAGVEKYIDTPVKRYSSGMYVRLAFAVAAFLEPEILIVDEVLAVGDAEFQKKCLGRMKDVSVNDGRTVLFVSHNMHSLIQLSTEGIFLSNGMIEQRGSIRQCIDSYTKSNINYEFHIQKLNEEIKSPCITKIKIEKEKVNEGHLEISFEFKSPFLINDPSIGIVLNDYLGNPVFGTNNRIHTKGKNVYPCKEGIMKVIIKDLSLLPGTYSLSAFLGDSISDFARYPNILSFELQNPKVVSTQIPDARYIGSLFLKDVVWELKDSN